MGCYVIDGAAGRQQPACVCSKATRLRLGAAGVSPARPF